MTDEPIIINRQLDAIALNARIQEYLGKGGKNLEITFRVGTGKQVSDPQRKYYFGVLVASVTTWYKSNMRELIKDVLDAVGFAVTTEFVHELFKMLFNNGKSTQINDTAKAEELYMKIRKHYAEKQPPLDLPEPNEEQYGIR